MCLTANIVTHNPPIQGGFGWKILKRTEAGRLVNLFTMIKKEVEFFEGEWVNDPHEYEIGPHKKYLTGFHVYTNEVCANQCLLYFQTLPIFSHKQYVKALVQYDQVTAVGDYEDEGNVVVARQIKVLSTNESHSKKSDTAS